MRIVFAVLLGLLPLGLVACGEEATPPARSPSAPLPRVRTYTAAEKAAHALECLERGPGTLGGLQFKKVHTRNLELATADLVFFEVEATKLLRDPARIARITGDVRRYGNAWHSILRLLIGFRLRPPDVVVAWTKPTFDLPDEEEYQLLQLEAVRVLGLVDDGRTADVLLSLYAAHPADRDLSAMALYSLNKMPTHRERALELALREGIGALWQSAPARLLGAMPERELDTDVAGVIAWWHALTAGSGPRMDTTLPNLKSEPWTQARLGVDPSVPPQVVGPDGSHRLRYGSISSNVAYGSGWFSTPLPLGPELPAHAMLFTGKLPAGEARCVLAQRGYAGYAAAVRADLELEDVDDGLYFAAKHCMLNVDPASDAVTVLKIRQTLDDVGAWSPERVRRLQRHVASVAACGDPTVWDVLARVLAEVRPLDIGRPAVEQAYDLMFRGDERRLRALIGTMLTQGTPADAGVALHLIRSARDPEYLDLLEARLDASRDEARRIALRRTLTFIYSGAVGIEPARYEAFVARYVGWLNEAEPQRFQALASGLLDFSDAGIDAFVRGLRGPQRTHYVRAWPRTRRLVPQAVAEAAVEPLDRRTSPVELNHMLGLAWGSFPASAAPALEALRRRLPKARQAPVEAALDRVLHRAPRHGDG